MLHSCVRCCIHEDSRCCIYAIKLTSSTNLQMAGSTLDLKTPLEGRTEQKKLQSKQQFPNTSEVTLGQIDN